MLGIIDSGTSICENDSGKHTSLDKHRFWNTEFRMPTLANTNLEQTSLHNLPQINPTQPQSAMIGARIVTFSLFPKNATHNGFLTSPHLILSYCIYVETCRSRAQGLCVYSCTFDRLEHMMSCNMWANSMAIQSGTSVPKPLQKRTPQRRWRTLPTTSVWMRLVRKKLWRQFKNQRQGKAQGFLGCCWHPRGFSNSWRGMRAIGLPNASSYISYEIKLIQQDRGSRDDQNGSTECMSCKRGCSVYAVVLFLNTCGRGPAPESGRGSSSSNLGVDSLDDLQVVQEAVLRRKFAGLEFEANPDAAEWKSECCKRRRSQSRIVQEVSAILDKVKQNKMFMRLLINFYF